MSFDTVSRKEILFDKLVTKKPRWVLLSHSSISLDFVCI